MPMQEFLASYAVRVDEDGARRLQRILSENRTSAEALTKAFTAARTALTALKAELSDSAGLKDIFSSLSSSLSSSFSGASLSSLSGSLSAASSNLSLPKGAASVSVSANLSAAEEALESYRAKAEALRPRLSVNAAGITSAVSSAIASVRSMMSSVSITIPVKAKASLDTSSLQKQASASSAVVAAYASGGRVAAPTLAMLAEEGSPEYVIPVKDESRALPLLRSLMSELSASARAQFLRSAVPVASSAPSVQAPVNIHVTAASASPEAVGQSIYDTARRSLLKTLEGVFA